MTNKRNPFSCSIDFNGVSSSDLQLQQKVSAGNVLKVVLEVGNRGDFLLPISSCYKIFKVIS